MKRYALKRCPFCDDTPDMTRTEPGYGAKFLVWQVICPCSASGPVSLKSGKQAAEDWNFRGLRRKKVKEEKANGG